MNAKNFLLAGIAGGVVDFLLGWLFYGTLFHDQFPGDMPNIVFIFLGCMTFGMFVSYIFVRWANLVTLMGGLKAGAVIGIFVWLADNFFMRAGTSEVDYSNFALDVAIGIVMAAVVGGVVAAVNGALSKRPA